MLRWVGFARDDSATHRSRPVLQWVGFASYFLHLISGSKGASHCPTSAMS